MTVDGLSDEHLEALHTFARRLGMKRAWFQNHRLAPHYDLTGSKRERALELGAAFVPAMDQARVRILVRSAAAIDGVSEVSGDLVGGVITIRCAAETTLAALEVRDRLSDRKPAGFALSVRAHLPGTVESVVFEGTLFP